MIALLRLFPSYQAMEKSVREAESARIKADDEVRFWRGRADWAESDRDRARMDLAGALKAISNWQAMITGAPVPFPEITGALGMAPGMAPAAAVGPQEAPLRSTEPRSLRDMQREAVAKSRQAAFKARQEHA